MTRITAVAVASVALAVPAAAEPPFRDLPWIWPEVIEITDRSRLPEVVSGGRARRPFDEGWTRPDEYDAVMVNVFLYRARYPGGHEIEFHVHPEYNRRRGRAGADIPGWWNRSRAAGRYSRRYRGPAYDERTLRERMVTEVTYLADMIGRLPGLMREAIGLVTLETGYGHVWANRQRREIRFHSRFNDKLESYGAAEEYLIHEAGHLLEEEYAVTDCWRSGRRRTMTCSIRRHDAVRAMSVT
ncbi:MAG: hypothetical protein OXH69_10070 [Acidobacteria bacterium]|nr:hypothetical protein [Acidobacteriota bacterium]